MVPGGTALAPTYTGGTGTTSTLEQEGLEMALDSTRGAGGDGGGGHQGVEMHQGEAKGGREREGSSRQAKNKKLTEDPEEGGSSTCVLAAQTRSGTVGITRRAGPGDLAGPGSGPLGPGIKRALGGPESLRQPAHSPVLLNHGPPRSSLQLGLLKL